MVSPRTPLVVGVLALLEGQGLQPAKTWLDETLPSFGDDGPTEGSPQERTLRIVFARARRKTGATSIEIDAEAAAAHGLPDAMAVPSWRAFDLARLALLHAQLDTLSSDEHVGLVTRLFRSGELSEQESLLRSLSYLPGPERFVDLAVDACRTNAVSVFSALATKNPYPAEHFSEASFNQMVLKALFIGAPAREIVGIEQRHGAELERMARGYASERTAAGRALSDDLQYVLGLSKS
ncbi:MAG: EboA domain-containing protein [Myxococcota bacterium]